MIPAFYIHIYVCIYIYMYFIYMYMCVCDLSFDELMVRAGLCPASYCGSNPCGMC